MYTHTCQTLNTKRRGRYSVRVMVKFIILSRMYWEEKLDFKTHKKKKGKPHRPE